MEAQEFRFTLKEGAVFIGWYTTAIKVAHNRLITPIQGEIWGLLPADGVLLQWQVKSPKQTTFLEGKLTDFQAGSVPQSVFDFK
jgi:hypothetical protein